MRVAHDKRLQPTLGNPRAAEARRCAVAEMGKWERRTLIFLPCAAIVMFVAGDISMSRYGLDPPYVYFYAGVWLKLAAFATAVGTVAFAFFLGAKHYVRMKREGERNA